MSGFAVEQKEFIAEGLNEVGCLPDCFIFRNMENMKNMKLLKEI